jgi:hypothetical protein
MSWNTTYSDALGNEYHALQLPWEKVREILGHAHRGVAEDDLRLCDWLEGQGFGRWHSTAGWTDEYGWGLIGPLRA